MTPKKKSDEKDKTKSSKPTKAKSQTSSAKQPAAKKSVSEKKSTRVKSTAIQKAETTIKKTTTRKKAVSTTEQKKIPTKPQRERQLKKATQIPETTTVAPQPTILKETKKAPATTVITEIPKITTAVPEKIEIKPAPQPPKPAPAQPPPQPPVEKVPSLGIIEINEYDTLKDLAAKLSITPAEITKKISSLGLYVALNQKIDKTLAEIIASEYNYEVKFTPVGKVLEEEKITGKEPRTPIITVMGHVDHGKTSLLDAIRQTNVTDTEHGGITQHIGAYKVKTPQGEITFLDTPGHEAFAAMRARGSKITDIVVLVVSAVDGVMPQTIEAIHHAQAAKVPIIVAINKIDLPGANPEKVKGELNQYNLSPEEWGGDTLMIEISARNKINIDKLLEAIHLQAEMMELKCDPDRAASGVVVESRLDPKKGPFVTVIVQNGTLKTGDAFVAGETYGKVRAMFDDSGKTVTVAKPSTPVAILGMSALPYPGDKFYVVKNEREAREIVENIKQTLKELSKKPPKTFSLDDITKQEDKILRIILKADVAGSLEAISEHIERIEHPEFKIQLVHSGIGNVSESDINLAKATASVVIGFNVRVESAIQSLAERSGVEVRIYQVIYELFDDIKKALEGMLAPKLQENITGKAIIKNVIKTTKAGMVAGSYVIEGKITRGSRCRLLRDGTIVYDGKIASLRRFKEDVASVEKGLECGITLENFQDIKENDIIEIYSIEKIKRFL